jgi:hypothetical protein
MIESIEQGRKEDGSRSIADKIKSRLHDLDKTVENNQGRWAWELLQNAKDSIAGEAERTVSIQIELNEDTVEFRHNGLHFTELDIRGLINQISSKEAEKGEPTRTTGRFGTGFLTTHLLSRKVKVSGLVKTKNTDFYSFDFLLDREGSATAELAPKVDSTWKEFQESAKKIHSVISEDDFNTSFCYLLEKDDQKEIARKGIEEFSNLIPYVLAFIPRISRVEINDNTTGEIVAFEVSRSKEESLLTTVEKTGNSSQTNVLILKIGSDKVSIATEVEKTERGYLVKNLDGIPKLFCDFPLIGTENFHFPVVVNSFFFNPQTERDGVWLKGIDDKEVSENQEILEESVELYKDLINRIADKNYFDLYNLALTKLPATDERYFDKNWFTGKVQGPIRDFLKKSFVVETINGKAKIEKVYFPDPELGKENREKIWQFSSDLGVNKLPIKIHVHKWSKIIWSDCLRVDLDDLVTDLKGQKNISALTKTIESDESQVFDWFNECIDYIYTIGGLDLFNDNSILPDQYGAFKSLKKLSIDETDDEVLKEVAFLVGFDFYEDLIHKGVFFKHSYNAVNALGVATEITKLIGQESRNGERINAITKLIKWFEDNEGKGKEIFPELYRKKEKLLVDTIDDKDSLYSILTSDVPISTIADIVNQGGVNPEKLSESIGKAQQLDALLQEFSVVDIVELKEFIESKVGSTFISKNEITKEDLLSLGVTSLEELEEALIDKDLAAQFSHKSTPTEEMFSYAQKIIKRAKDNIIDHLLTLPAYDCTEREELATTVIGGVKKQGLPMHIVVRPSDNNQVIVYYRSETDTLDYENSELWIENGKSKPKLLTLGKILKSTKIIKIPL